jgi:tetratricopeptide (TPR) repeat protein
MRIFLLFLPALLFAVPVLSAQTQAQRNEAAARAAHEDAAEKYNAGLYSMAIEDWTRAMELAPREAMYVFNRGLARRGRNDFAAALADFTEAIRLNPNEVRYYVERGAMHAKLKNPAGAVADFTAAINRKPDDANYYATRAVARAHLYESSAALADLNVAIRLKPDEASYYAVRGVIYAYLDQPAAAIADADRSVSLQPRSAEHRLHRASMYRTLGRLPEALTNVKDALDLNPREPRAYTERGILLQAMGDPDKALGDYLRASNFAATEDYVHFLLYSLQKRKRDEDFVNLANNVAEWPRGWDRSLGLYLLEALSEKELLEEATSGSAHLRRPQLAQAHYYLGMEALSAGSPAKARGHFQKSLAQGVRELPEHTLAVAELKALK